MSLETFFDLSGWRKIHQEPWLAWVILTNDINVALIRTLLCQNDNVTCLLWVQVNTMFSCHLYFAHSTSPWHVYTICTRLLHVYVSMHRLGVYAMCTYVFNTTLTCLSTKSFSYILCALIQVYRIAFTCWYYLNTSIKQIHSHAFNNTPNVFVNPRIVEKVWPDLAKFRHFWRSDNSC